jgi:hypothetical protein
MFNLFGEVPFGQNAEPVSPGFCFSYVPDATTPGL